MFWRPPRAGRGRPGVPAHIWLPKICVLPSCHHREGKRKNLGVVQFLAPDLPGSPPVGLPWAWQLCQHPEKHSQARLGVPQPAPIPCQGQLPGSQPQSGSQGWIRGSRGTIRQHKLHLFFSHLVSFPTCWQLLPLGEGGLPCSRRAPGLLPQAPGKL